MKAFAEAHIDKIRNAMLRIITYVLDDDIEELELLQPYLEKACGVDFLMFTDIDEFISAVAEGVHIAIIDHRLNAGIDGIDVGRKVLDKNPLIFLILYSGSSEKKVWQRATNAGFRGLIDKGDPDCYEQIEQMIVSQKGAIERRKEVYDSLSFLHHKYAKYLS